MNKQISAAELAKLANSGVKVERIPMALESAIEEFKSVAIQNQSSAADMMKMFEAQIQLLREQIAVEAEDRRRNFDEVMALVREKDRNLDVEAISRNIAETIARSLKKPNYEFEIHRDESGYTKTITARKTGSSEEDHRGVIQ